MLFVVGFRLSGRFVAHWGQIYGWLNMQICGLVGSRVDRIVVVAVIALETLWS